MALENVVFQQNSYSYGFSDIYVLGGGGPGSYCLGLEEDKVWFETPDNNLQQGFNTNLESSPSSLVQASVKERQTNTSLPEKYCTTNGLLAQGLSSLEASAATVMNRRKRRHTRNTKSKEEKNNQRMTHIAVERNRRKQMNDHLTMLRSMMPATYVQKGDQASIIGGALNFVKELEQHLQSLEAQKRVKQPADGSLSSVFSGFFTFPQYTTSSTESSESIAEKHPGIADIEVTMVEHHANIKVLSRKHPKQLLEMVARLHSLHLIVLHLNVTTVDDMALYSFSHPLFRLEDPNKDNYLQ